MNGPIQKFNFRPLKCIPQSQFPRKTRLELYMMFPEIPLHFWNGPLAFPCRSAGLRAVYRWTTSCRCLVQPDKAYSSRVNSFSTDLQQNSCNLKIRLVSLVLFLCLSDICKIDANDGNNIYIPYKGTINKTQNPGCSSNLHDENKKNSGLFFLLDKKESWKDEYNITNVE